MENGRLWRHTLKMVSFLKINHKEPNETAFCISLRNQTNQLWNLITFPPQTISFFFICSFYHHCFLLLVSFKTLNYQKVIIPFINQASGRQRKCKWRFCVCLESTKTITLDNWKKVLWVERQTSGSGRNEGLMGFLKYYFWNESDPRCKVVTVELSHVNRWRRIFKVEEIVVWEGLGNVETL